MTAAGGISLEEALARSRANPGARPMRREGVRREPEVWPRLRPSFRFDRSSRLFAVGSCFARNIEAELLDLGFAVRSAPAAHGIGLHRGVFNKYSPATILQEMEWTARIRARDGIVSPDDARAVATELPDGRWIDTQLHAQEPLSFGALLAQRAEVFHIWRELFSAEVVILTLGLVEVWRDLETGLCLQNMPGRALARFRGRYVFERHDYEQCLARMRAALALLCRADGSLPHILLTTSPVVLQRTFTEEDAEQANCYSKSVLRAVCGKLAEETPGADYFPSFESVTLSPRETVWEDDLCHVRAAFVQRIMARVREAYVSEAAQAEAAEADLARQVTAACARGAPAEALALLERISAPLEMHDPLFHLHAALLLAEAGQPERAVAHLQPDRMESARTTDWLQLLCRRALEGAGRADLVPPGLAEAPLSAGGALQLARHYQALGRPEAVRAALDGLTPADVSHPSLRARALNLLAECGAADRAIALLEGCVALWPQEAEPRRQLAVALAEAGRAAEALEQARAAAQAPDAGPAELRLAVRLMMQAGALEEAAARLDAFLATGEGAAPDHALRDRLDTLLARRRA
ncbi:GSCFA domain-containing protein (plasmid) [Paroceanicella profunda]|uniref:GSCFA domain-containing protein n=1 Tax=Paroceanicella profunda TaxID=2579971 RepID=A0A5B8G266_9RHOB|nr:GSCFA domain-containing protein [Paroceanicella profunda]QDL94164.1 GSCFA domain-containing protein [Paroceanicella profunda]